MQAHKGVQLSRRNLKYTPFPFLDNNRGIVNLTSKKT